VGLHFAEVIGEWSEGVGFGGEAKGGEEGLMDWGRPPTLELETAVQEHLPPAHPARVVDLDAGDLGTVAGDRESQALEQRKIDVDVEKTPNSQERSKILGMGKWRRKTKLRQYSTCFSE